MEIPTALRRFVSISATILVALTLTSLLPIWLITLAGVGVARRSKFVILRITCFAWIYSVAQIYGLVSYALLRIRFLTQKDRCTTSIYQLQTRWTSILFWAASGLLNLRITVEGEEALDKGPVILLFRHSSLVDTLLPGVCIAKTKGLRIRYILKKELLWDPCLDLVGNYLPNYFVHRDGDAQTESDNISTLSTSLASNEAVLIYPEGTRFSSQKRQRILDRWTQTDDPRLQIAEQLTDVLPPKTKGVFAIRKGSLNSDVVFCAHSGLENVTTIATLLAVASHGLEVRVSFWRIPHTEVPRDEVLQRKWLFQEWIKMNNTVVRLKNTKGARPL